MKLYKVTRQHRSEYPHPIHFAKGATLFVGEEYQGQEEWHNWFYCRTEDGAAGWVPEQIFKRITNDTAIALKSYTARELNVDEGDKLYGSTRMNGWIWCEFPNCSNKVETSGWVPIDNLTDACTLTQC
ncbi:SH3 domain-containing protein [Photobacterium ganghwense]|uniref:SH3 domain-containing protein n=1 Tax=Photobacterium ganghwense TaxID=320778 RepID=UPI0040562589